ncbi:ABC transporter ATP-binding protein [Streptomyces sp. NPDC004721]
MNTSPEARSENPYESPSTDQATARTPILAIEDLSVSLEREGRSITLVDQVNLTVMPKERVALVGESGSGKTLTAHAVIGLTRKLRVGGRITFQGRDLVSMEEREMRTIRGAEIGMVFQDPLRALDPITTIGAQLAEPLRIRGVGKREAYDRAASILDEVGVARAKDRLKAYPHEFSGGMRQRVVLAMALIAQPRVLIADEPTTALDVRVQEQVLALIDRIAEDRELAVLLITHDLGVVSGFADRAAVMYAGRIVEENRVDRLFLSPRHPYTRGLLGAVPRVSGDRELISIPGSPAAPTSRPAGCAFHPRCSQSTDACAEIVPALRATADTGTVACLVADVSAAKGVT